MLGGGSKNLSYIYITYKKDEFHLNDCDNLTHLKKRKSEEYYVAVINTNKIKLSNGTLLVNEVYLFGK